jgi:hypothetical protein
MVKLGATTTVGHLVAAQELLGGRIGRGQTPEILAASQCHTSTNALGQRRAGVVAYL